MAYSRKSFQHDDGLSWTSEPTAGPGQSCRNCDPGNASANALLVNFSLVSPSKADGHKLREKIRSGSHADEFWDKAPRYFHRWCLEMATGKLGSREAACSVPEMASIDRSAVGKTLRGHE